MGNPKRKKRGTKDTESGRDPAKRFEGEHKGIQQEGETGPEKKEGCNVREPNPQKLREQRLRKEERERKSGRL